MSLEDTWHAEMGRNAQETAFTKDSAGNVSKV
jgi:hypothetical protein